MTSATPARAVGTLFGVPQTQDLSAASVAVLGIPFDMGYHASRVGSRTGPVQIREHSMLVREGAGDLGVDPVLATGLVDCGDLDLMPGQIVEALAIIDQGVTTILDAGTIPLTLGGDGAVSLPQIRAVSRHYQDLVVLHFDAHSDAYDWTEPFLYNNANSFLHAAEEDLIDTASSFHVGVRDTDLLGGAGGLALARELGYTIVTMGEIEQTGVQILIERLQTELRGRKVYLSWDMDVFDPSSAPGVVTPAWGGLTSREGLQILRGLRGLDVVAFDINTVSPPHDSTGQTASLAARVALECLIISLSR